MEIYQEMGDGCLVSFDLASDAVRCAKAIQMEVKKQAIPLKIGIHEGEMDHGWNGYPSDGVNVASRLQEIGSAGCIYISEIVFHDIKNKADLITNYIGENTLKGISKSIKVFEINIQGAEDKSEIGTTSKAIQLRNPS